MTKEEFARRWDEAERRAAGGFWAVYSAGTVIAVLVALAGAVLLATPARTLGGALLAFALLDYGILQLVKRSYWTGWLSANGLVCSCGHVLTSHTGTYLKPHQPGLCSVCAAGGACRRVKHTGKCDKCGAAIFA